MFATSFCRFSPFVQKRPLALSEVVKIRSLWPAYDHAPAALLLGHTFDKNTFSDQSKLSMRLQANWAL